VTYKEKLGFDLVWKYDLLPEDIMDRAEMVFWREGEDAEWLKEDYMAAPVELLEEYRYRDIKAWAALVLKGAI